MTLVLSGSSKSPASFKLTIADSYLSGGTERKYVVSPEYILDFATLTGAMVITLGHIATGIMGTDEKLIEKVKNSAENTFEKVWELPLWPEFLKQVKSEIADVKNIGAARQAGTIAGGAFLKEFVGDNIPWVHFDIAGTAWGSEPNSINPKGSATGWGIRLVLDMMKI